MFVFHWILFVPLTFLLHFIFHSRLSTFALKISFYIHNERCIATVVFKEWIFHIRFDIRNEWSNNERSKERQFQGKNAPGSEFSWERKFQGTNGLGNEFSRKRMVPRTKVSSWERMFQGTNNLENEYSWYQITDYCGCMDRWTGRVTY